MALQEGEKLEDVSFLGLAKVVERATITPALSPESDLQRCLVFTAPKNLTTGTVGKGARFVPSLVKPQKERNSTGLCAACVAKQSAHVGNLLG
jgi:hypothetical protein